MTMLSVFLAFCFVGVSSSAVSIPPIPPGVSTTPASGAAVVLTARKGPIELTFRLLERKVTTPNRFWYQLEVKNIGRSTITVTDDAWLDPGAMHWNLLHRRGLFIEAVDAQGKPVGAIINATPHEPLVEPPYVSTDPVESAKVEAMRERWRSEGVAETEITIRLHRYAWSKEAATPIPVENHSVALFPGRSVATRPWAFLSEIDRARGRERPLPRGAYAELHALFLKVPGKYRLRAVFDRSISASTIARYKALGLTPPKAELADVKAATRWIDVEVLP